MSQQLFHCTNETYAPGDVIGPYEQSRFNERQQAKGYGCIEQALEDDRPDHQPCSRVNAVYASDDAANAAIFYGAQSGTKGRCYAVKVETSSKAPMALVGLMDMAKGDAQKQKEIVAEYWTPQTQWRFMEYFASSMTVVEEVPWPNVMLCAIAQQRYADDRARGRQHWNLVSPMSSTKSNRIQPSSDNGNEPSKFE